MGIREHCSWVGDDVARNTEKAIRLIRAGLYSAAHYVPLEEKLVEVTKSALIVGGGVSGLSAALFLSNMGMHVYLVEKGPVPRRPREDAEGHLAHEDRTAPQSSRRWKRSLRGRSNVEIFTSTAVSNFEGAFGNYRATSTTPTARREVTAGGCIIAIGFSPFDARQNPSLPTAKTSGS